MGNSEVGHLNLGAGQVVRQDLTRIDDAIADGSFADNRVLRDALAVARERGRVHLLGLVSRGGVHSSMDHLEALIDAGRPRGRRRHRAARVHRRARHGARLRRRLRRGGRGNGSRDAGGRVASVTGRYYAMDRDSRWDRIKLAMDALVRGEAEGRHAATGEEAVRAAYERGETDEFIKPTLVGEKGRIEPGDVVIFFNFRPDRARQLTQALNTEMELSYTTLTEYREDWDYPVAFPPERPATTLAEMLERARARPAARGGDREVPARDLLLQRRRGGRARGRGALPRRLAPRRPHLRPQARDERARGRRRVHRALGAPATTPSGSSTSPTRTWSATRA